MDVARLNMSHGAYADHEAVYRLVRQASDDTGHAIGIFADLQGPKIRLERFADGPVKLKRGATFTITTRDVEGTVDICGTTYKGLPGDVKPGDPLLIDDGKVRLKVVSVDDTDVVTEVVVPGKVSNNKGINLPGVAVSVPGAVGEGHRGPALGAQPRRRLHRAELRAPRRRRRGRARGDARGGHLRPDHRQDREAPGDRQHRRDRRRLRRHHGRARRPRRGVPARGRADPPEAHHRQGPPQRQARHRRHPDARVDDHLPGADARRGQRRRQRRARRCRRGDAVGRDERGGVPHRRRRDDGPHRAVHRGARAQPHGGRGRGSRTPAAASSPRRPPRSPSASRRSTSSPSPSAATPRSGSPATAARSRSSRSPPWHAPAPSSR